MGQIGTLNPFFLVVYPQPSRGRCTVSALYRAMDMTLWLPQAESTLGQVEGQ